MAKNKRMYLIIIDNTRDLKSLGVRAVWVQVPLRLPWEIKNNQSNKQCRINHRKVVFLCLKFAYPKMRPKMMFPRTHTQSVFLFSQNW